MTRKEQEFSHVFVLQSNREYALEVVLIGKVAQAHMAIGMGSGMMSNGEAREFMQELQRRAHHHNLADVAASCIVDFEVAMTSKHDGRAQDPAQRFDELALFNEFVKN
ncbi:hypothetical protein NW762_001423 [Fusarium torreyae]|uniref:Uncharacterized protein n=1 Tax=Fusarium torreyae TaxID=1237075 RepID=A0A9W8SDG2_9HYPO|nr:hypothetical protein NW762_001423 [Fusarium torreyae]